MTRIDALLLVIVLLVLLASILFVLLQVTGMVGP